MAIERKPVDPDSRRGELELLVHVARRLHTSYPGIPWGAFVGLAKISVPASMKNGNGEVNLIDMAKVIDIINAEHTGAPSDPAGWTRRVLEAFPRLRLRPGIHFEGEVDMNRNGRPSLVSKRNKKIHITQRGALILLGDFFPDRVQFLNCIWDLMTHMYQAYMNMKQELVRYETERQREELSRSGHGLAYLDEARLATGMSRQDAHLATLQKGHKDGRRCFFRGRTPTLALRTSGHLKQNQKAGPIHRILSKHGLIADQYRLSFYAQFLRVNRHLVARVAAGSMEEKKKALHAALRICTQIFTERGIFDIPHATETQQTEAFFDLDRVAKRPEIVG